MIVPGLYIIESLETGPWVENGFDPVGTLTKSSSPDAGNKVYEDSVVNETPAEVVVFPDVEPLWKICCVSEKSSPGYEKLSNAWSSSCWVGVYKATLSGLFDLPVTSDLAEDIGYDIWETLGYILADRLLSYELVVLWD